MLISVLNCQKLVLVWAIFLLVTITSIEAIQKPSFVSAKNTTRRPDPSLTKQLVGLNTGFKVALVLEYISYIYYPIYFYKDQDNIKALIDLSSKVDIIHLAYAKKIRLLIQKTDVGV